MPQAHCYIEAGWCDVEGVYLRGWAHCGEEAVRELYLRCGESRAVVQEFYSRSDVLAAFPAIPSDRCGFSAYLPCVPFRPVFVGATTDSGTSEVEVHGDAFQAVVRQPDAAESADSNDRFIAEMKARAGHVVEIGARSVSPGAVSRASHFTPECRFTGVDIHAADGVHLVADAHFLSRAIEPESIDGVFSMAVLEHLAAPWLVAAEVNRILKIGGLTYHVAPHSWPVHEMPNDFWRMSDAGLRSLFGPHLGFEVLEAGMTTPVQMITHRELRHPPYLEFPLFPGMASAFILARKVAHLAPDAVAWPIGKEESQEQSSRYPCVGGIA